MYRAAVMAALVLLVILLVPSVLRLIRKGRSAPYAFFSLKTAERTVDQYLVNPERLLAQHRLLPGTSVLLVGPDPRLFSLGAARLVAPGHLTCLDTEPQRLKKIKEKALENNIPNIVTLAGDVAAMPFSPNRFDQIVLISTLGKIGDPEAALAEMARVLKDNGRLTISDSILAPDYQAARSVIRLAGRAGFAVNRKTNNMFFYTLEMVKPLKAGDLVDRKARSPNRDMAWPERLRG